MSEKTFLVLCEETDLDALWAWRGLRALGLARIELVTAGMLSNALRWSHSVGDGDTGIEMTLADGRVIRSENVDGVLNRLMYVPLGAAGVPDAERAYAEQEWSAFFVSWLHSLPGQMLNRPVPLGLCGAHRNPADWTWLAVEAGLPVLPCKLGVAAPLRLTPPAHDCMWVVGDFVVGANASVNHLTGACRRLAASAGCGLLGLEFAWDSDGTWRFFNATPTPPLHPGGDALLAALANTLRGPR